MQPGSPEYRERQREYMRNYPREKKLLANKQRRERRKGKDGDLVRALQMESYYRRRDKVLEKNKENWRLNAHHFKAKARERKYGVSAEEYAEMLVEQHGRCAICDQERKLGVDHNHATGAVRKLLCSPCNTALGLFKEDPARLIAAIEYLQSHQIEPAVAAKSGALEQPQGGMQ